MCRKNNRLSPDIPRLCEYCEHAAIINDESNVLCDIKGIVDREYKCKKYFYDPLKRSPKPLPPLPTLSEEDLVI